MPVDETNKATSKPAPDVMRPEKPMRTPIGNEPRQFAEILLEYMDSKEYDEDLAEAVRGFGRAIARCIPKPVWDALHTVAAATPLDQVPQVQILSEEPFVPWELAATEPPLLPQCRLACWWPDPGFGCGGGRVGA